MKKLKPAIAALILLTFGIVPDAVCQWVPTNGPYGRIIRALAASGTSLFASGVYRSTDSGASWALTNNGLPTNINAGVVSFAVSGTNIFAGTDDFGIFLSTDNGNSWNAVNTGLPYDSANGGGGYPTVNTIVVSGTNILASLDTLYISTNNGINWAPVKATSVFGTYIPVRGVMAFAEIGKNIFAGIGYDGPFISDIFRSTDNGASWVNDSLLHEGTVPVLAASGTNLYAASQQWVFLSTDSGKSWTNISNGLSNAYVTALTVSGPNLIAGTDTNGIFLSTDNGKSWNPVNTSMTNYPVNAFVESGTNVFAGSDQGIFRSTDNGSSWTAAFKGLLNTYYSYFGLAANDTQLFVGTGAGLALSTDIGASWTVPNSALLHGVEISSIVQSGANLFIAADAGTFLSTDDGTNWTLVNNGLPQFNYVTALAESGGNLFAGTDGRNVFVSTDDGSSWITASNGLSDDYVFAFAVSGSNLFAGTYDGGVFLTTDNGTNWTDASTGLPANTSVYVLAVSDTNLFAGTDSGIYVSSDNGTSWASANVGLEDTVVNAIVVSGTKIFAAIAGNGIYLSTNNGVSWTPVDSGLPYLNVVALAVNDSILFAGIDPFYIYNYGIWRRPLSEMAGYQPLAEVHPLTIDFGRVHLGQCKDTTVMLVNAGTSELTLSKEDIADTNYFTILDATPVNVAVGDSIPLHIQFCPKDTSIVTTIDSMVSNAPQSLILVTLIGSGKIGILSLPAVLDFGLVNEDSCKDSGFYAVNSGNDSLLVTKNLLSGSNFIVISPTTPIVIPSNDSVFVSIKFCSLDTGSFSANDALVTDIPSQPAIQLLAHTLLKHTDSGGVLCSYVEAVPNQAKSGDTMLLLLKLGGNSNLLTSKVLHASLHFNTDLLSPLSMSAGDCNHPVDSVIFKLEGDSGVDCLVYYSNSYTLPIDSSCDVLEITVRVMVTNTSSTQISIDSLNAGPSGISILSACTDVARFDLIIACGDSTLSSFLQGRPLIGAISVVPNPFSQSSTITFSCAESGVGEVTIVNLLGTEVARIFSGELSVGEHSLEWDASQAAAGMYECVVHVGGSVQRVPLAVMR